MREVKSLQRAKQEIIFVSASELLANNQETSKPPFNHQDKNYEINDNHPTDNSNIATANHIAISDLHLPFALKVDQTKAVEAWMANQSRGSIIYGSGTGKTEIAFECARRIAELKNANNKIARLFNILLLVPRIVLVEQDYERLIRYGISSEKVGKYFGEEKQIKEVTICTYNSVLRNLELVRRANMIIFDEMHLATGAFSKIIDTASEDPDKALLGLTATIDERDPKNAAIISLLPPVRKYLIKDAVMDKRLARPIIFPIKVILTEKEQILYNEYSAKIQNISKRFKRFDARDMMELMKHDGFPRWQAKAWFSNVRKRKQMLASSANKLAVAVELITEKHSGQKVMVFSETLESVKELKQLLNAKGTISALIDSKIPSFRRQKILSDWGKRFYALLSVHTLEIGYDVPEASIEIILATTSNMNQIVQRIGRVLRKIDGKDSALVYLIYASDTKDDNILKGVRKAIETSGGTEKRTAATEAFNLKNEKIVQQAINKSN